MEFRQRSSGEPQRTWSDIDPGDRKSLRRRASSWASNQITPVGENDGSGNEEERDLRGIPLHMALKRAVRRLQQLQAPVVSDGGLWRQRRSAWLRRISGPAGELASSLVPWRRTLQKIGGNFGGGVQSYFLLLRFLVLLNLASFLLIAGFVLVPSAVFRSTGDVQANVGGPPECTTYDPNPQGLVPFYSYFLDLLSGTGFMEFSYMFYGFYSNTVVADSSFSYNVPLAYLCTVIFYFACCLLVIIVRMGNVMRVVVVTGGGAVGNYSMMVFTGWDYGCLGDRATRLKQRNIHYQLQMELEEERIKRRAEERTSVQKVVLYALRVFMSLLALGLIAAAFFGIFKATQFSQLKTGEEGFLGLVYEYLPSIVITAGNFVVPLMCDQIALAEKYAPATTVIVALSRAVFLRLVSLGALLYSLWTKITCHGDVNNNKCSLCQYNQEAYQCWETRVGQEMYKLTLFDLLVTIAVLVLVEFPRRMVVDNWSNKLARLVGRQEFVVSYNVLGLIYSQTVVWTGALFCPLLPLINAAKMVIIFYCKKVTLFYNCRPAPKTFRSSTSNLFFLLVLLFGWALATAVMIYSVSEMHPSMGCGPFRSFPSMWAIVPASFHDLPRTARAFLFFVSSQAFSIPLFVLACVAMCYFISLASVYGNSVALLRAQIKLEGRDKQFLVKQIEEVSRRLQMTARD